MTTTYRVEGMTRGQLTVTDGRRKIVIEGEVLPFAKPGETSYVLYSSSIRSWTADNGSEPVTPEEKQSILDFVADWAKLRMTMEIE